MDIQTWKRPLRRKQYRSQVRTNLSPRFATF